MLPFVSEFIGTAILIIFGNGVVANVVLNKTKGQQSGWIVITFGWAMAVFIAVYIAAKGSGAHLNPAVSLSLALMGKMEWTQLPIYVIAQISGAMMGQVFVWLAYRDHFNVTENKDLILATFSTSPAIPNKFNNFISELIGTFIFILGVLFILAPSTSLGSLDALPVALLVFGIGLSLGGTTGYAINPARDLGPRIIHAIISIPHKGSSEWHYSWVPILGPLAGSALGTLVFQLLNL